MTTIGTIAEQIRDVFFPLLRENVINIFLVGASPKKKNSHRHTLGRMLTSPRHKREFDVYYPEDLFQGLMVGRRKRDLLTLENTLALSVHAVVIVLESPGSFAELGAFANHEMLRDRLLVLVDELYSRDTSFINRGPVALLKRPGKKQVKYLPFSKMNDYGQEIRRLIRDIALQVSVDQSPGNLIMSQHSVLAALYVVGPMRKHDLRKFLKLSVPEPSKDLEPNLEASLSILKAKGHIGYSGSYSITTTGRLQFLQRIAKAGKASRAQSVLDSLRIAVLNCQLRSKKSLWGKEARSSAQQLAQ